MAVSDVSQTDDIASAFARLFPLPLTTMELFMVADARVDYPMLIDLELRFQGCIDRAAFEAGLAFALARNPLFTCLIERNEKGRLAWVPSNQMPRVVWTDLYASFDDHYDKFIDLTKEIGLRIWVRQGLERSSIMLHFHHACSDGIGAFGFTEDLVAGYVNAYSPHTPVAPRPLDPSRLLRRGEVGMAGRGRWRRIVDSLVGTREGIRFALQKPHPLEPGPSAITGVKEPPLRPGLLMAPCTREVTQGLRRTATSMGATVNDLLMRDLFLTLRRWNAQRNPRNDHGCLRIMMPQNLRVRDDAAMPATNLMSVSFLTRKARLCDTPDQLLRSLQEETDAVRRGLLSVYSLGALASLQSVGALSKILEKPRCLSTAVLSNVGDPSRRFSIRLPRCGDGVIAANLIFECISGVPPLRPLTRVTLSAGKSASAIILCLKCDPHYHSASDAQYLLDDYMAQLAATAESKSLPSN